jgi:hypothetical protein
MPGWLNRVLPHVDIEGAGVRERAAGASQGVDAPPAAAEP